MSRKKRQKIIFGIIGAVAIGVVIAFSYSSEQTKIKGFTFGNNLQSIQDELKKIQTDFEAETTIWEEGEISNDEFLEFSEKHVSKMEELISRYDSLEPPDAFATSVELFKLSTQSQLESDKEIIKWVETGDDVAKIRAEFLLEDSFEYELQALAKFNAAKAGIDQ